MAHDPAKQIAKLDAAEEPIASGDSIAEAGRKVLLASMSKVLKHEVGSRTDIDPEDVHKMRVDMRKSRSLFRLLSAHFKKSVIRQFNRDLGDLAGMLGEVRDLDVLLTKIRAFQSELSAEQQTDLQELLNELERQRLEARKEWSEKLDSRDYRRFLKAYIAFLVTSGAGVKASTKDKDGSNQIRFLLPAMIYEQLATVRAYETRLDKMDTELFHELRIAFKRLRYVVSSFEPVLGAQVKPFLEELKTMQDCLGDMHDCVAARDRLHDLPKECQTESLDAYITHLDEHETALREQFYELWTRFNTRRVQQQLSSAVLGLH